MTFPGKFNIFQETMLLWNEVNPYNAIHVVRVPVAFEHLRLQAVVNRVIEESGLTGYVIDLKKRRFAYRGGASDIRLRIIREKRDYDQSLAHTVDKELNERFDIDSILTPFRAFAIPAEDFFYFGLVYFHPISGGDSIVMMIRRMILSYLGRQVSDESPKLKLYPLNYRHYLAPNLKYILRWFLRLPRQIAEVKRFHRPRYSLMMKPQVGFILFKLNTGDFEALTDKSRTWDVTVHDIFLSLVLKSLSALGHERTRHLRRQAIGLASIVNIRRDFASEGLENFGVFLSAFAVSHNVPADISLKDLSQEISDQTRAIKKHRRYLGTLIGLVFAYILLGLAPESYRERFFRKYYPLWGGLTNVDIKRLWTDADEIPVDYFRAVSTSPAYPLVFSMTSVCGHLNIGVSYNKAVFRETQVKRIIDHFLNEIQTSPRI